MTTNNGNNGDGGGFKLPVRPLVNPLNEDDKAKIEHVLAQLPTIHDLLMRCHACGLDVADRLAKHEMHHKIATALKDHFFPDVLPTIQE